MLKRPLLLAAACFSLGCALSLWGSSSAMAGIVMALLLLAVSWVARLRKRRQLLVLVALFLASGLGHAWLYIHHATPPTFQEAYWRTGEVEGRVVDAPAFWPGITYAQLWVQTGQGMALIRWSEPTGPQTRFAALSSSPIFGLSCPTVA